jgi:MoaA/NifB/PqqE/SkfB family radical SAM enzyme
MARNAGCRTGFTTNGIALSVENIGRALEEQVDIISVSLAGASETRHGSLRRRAPWRRILSNLETLVEVRTSRGFKSPWIELHFLMMQSNICELPDFVRLAADIGVDEVVATNLTATPTQKLDKMRVFDWHPQDAYLDAQEEAHRTAMHLGIKLRTYPLVMNADVLTCAAQPETIVYITSRGEIAPCVYLGMNVVRDIRRTFLGEAYTVSRMIFGNVRDGLDVILDASLRREFLAAWRARQTRARTWGNLAMYSGSADWDLPPVPSACETCYKRYGV